MSYSSMPLDLKINDTFLARFAGKNNFVFDVFLGITVMVGKITFSVAVDLEWNARKTHF